MAYGNTTSEQTTYNARLQPASHTLNNMNYQNTNICCSYPTYSTMTWNYGYYNDGTLEHAWDTTNEWFDRAYKYDQASRLKEASTFRRARGLSPYPAINYPDPYFQRITYDAFDHSNRAGKLYTGEPSDVGTYVNNRRTGWVYDADGNNTLNSSYQQTIDAAGTTIRSISQGTVGDGLQYPYQPRLDITQTYDGSGEPAKRVQISRQPGVVDEFGNPGQPIEDTQTTHYVKSTVLAGATVAELGWGDTIHIYAGGQRIAREFLGNTTFEHQNPMTGSWVTSHGHSSYRTTAREERDPRGAEAPLSNPYAYAQNYVEWKFSQPLFIEGGDPYDFSSGREIDGLPVSEAEFQRRVGNGSVGLGKVDSKGNIYFAGNTLDFGSSVWIDDWNLTYSTSNTEFPLTALPDGSVVMTQGPSVTVYISRSGHFITAAEGLKLVTSLSRRFLLPQNPAAQFLYWTHDQNSKFGHTALRLQDGTYISYWPTCYFGKDPQPFKHCPARSSNYDADVAGEENRTPQTILITGLDEQAIKQWWNDGKGHGDFSLWNNCSDIVSDALRVGGLPIGPTTVYSTPEYVRGEIERLLHERQYPPPVPSSLPRP